eukprot:CAMPEP_0184249078 /NCGR_PEP_ID=MMETSP0977-20130417/3620_1 /TAXON_ID=483370 /ORGANISM="non described non described, Strain CCMP2097" /LENGTH=77 /DNA_ID=CAMNT_0026554461 /DNA_START=49 /DNA_END=279 /DNA_ORIENTATION=+
MPLGLVASRLAWASGRRLRGEKSNNGQLHPTDVLRRPMRARRDGLKALSSLRCPRRVVLVTPLRGGLRCARAATGSK